MRDPLDLRFVVVVGKGGVGKSAASAALAMAAARRGKRVLVAMCNARERLSYLLEVDPVGPQIRRVLERVDAVNIEPGAALEEYGMMILKIRALYKLVFDNRFVSAFLRGTPGIEAWAMLGKAQYHAFEQLPGGQPRYDLVVVDAPATGHGLDLLRVPRVIMDVVPPGLLRQEAERAWGLFSDPARAGVFLVTLAEELPVNETIELHASIRQELRLPICGLAINQVLPELFAPEELETLQRIRDEAPPGSSLRALAHAGWARAGREAVQIESMARLDAAITAPRYELPLLLGTDFRRAQVEALSRCFDERALSVS